MNIFDDHERNNQEAGHYHDREEIGASREQNTNKEDFDFGKCQGIAIYCLIN